MYHFLKILVLKNGVIQREIFKLFQYVWQI